MAMKRNIRKTNIIITGSPGKTILGADLHFQMKGLLNHLDLFWYLSEISTAQVCPYILLFGISLQDHSIPYYLSNNNTLTVQSFTYYLTIHF